jgi:hypothetical protein
MRGRVHAVLNEQVPAGDERDDHALVEMVAGVLGLSDSDRNPVGTYVQSWRQDMTRP